MGIFDKLKEPVFLKEGSTSANQIEVLRELRPQLNEEGKKLINQDIRCLECGIEGENNIAFELRNSHMPMYVIHDLYLKEGNLSAQIDYLVITRKLYFLIECKNLYGNITIDSNGEFVRTMNYGKTYKKEGIYSPITQSQRHLELLKQKKLNTKGFVQKMMLDHYFTDFYKSVVVLANPRTVLNDRYAKKEIKNQVIRADQLIQYLKNLQNQSKEASSTDEQMLRQARLFLSWNEQNDHTYTAKYEPYKISTALIKNTAEKSENQELLVKELKSYRLNKSREEHNKPYFIYNDKQLADLIYKMPHTADELENVDGFGKVKVQKYGADILAIVRKYDCALYF